MDYKLDTTEENDVSLLVKALDSQLKTIRNYSEYSSLSYFMDDPIKRYDFLDGVHHMADQLYNFWKRNPGERAKVISRAHIRQAQYRNQLRHKKEKIKKQMVEGEKQLNEMAKQYDQLCVKLEEDLVDDPIDYVRRMKLDEKYQSQIIDYIEGKTVNIRNLFESEIVLRNRLVLDTQAIKDELSDVRNELTQEIETLVIHNHNLQSRLLAQVASLESECRIIEFKPLLSTIAKQIRATITDSNDVIFADRINSVTRYSQVKQTYIDLYKKNDSDRIFSYDDESYTNSKGGSEIDIEDFGIDVGSDVD